MSDLIKLNIARAILGEYIINGLNDLDSFKVNLSATKLPTSSLDEKGYETFNDDGVVTINISFIIDKTQIYSDSNTAEQLSADSDVSNLKINNKDNVIQNSELVLTPTFENNDHTLRVFLSWKADSVQLIERPRLESQKNYTN